MRRRTPLPHLLYNYLYPQPTSTDPPSFSAHLARNLVPEVRIEVATYYGDLSSLEARYPGLNYCYAPHRMRLGRFIHHRRLFEAFDNLGLTYKEIQDFCCWEGTRWARDRYEKDEGVKIVDTTGDDIKPFVDRREQRALEDARRHNITRKTDISVIVEDAGSSARPTLTEDDEGGNDAEMSDAEAEAEDASTATEQEPLYEAAARQQHIAEVRRRAQQSITQRLISAWEQGLSLSPEMEQLIKEQTEQGRTLSDAHLIRLIQANRAANHNAVGDTQTSRAAA